MTENLSFVVQGPVLKDSAIADGIFSTKDVLSSIRTHFPGSEIILSTWKGTETSGLEYDKVILNDDPGAIVIPGVSSPFNHNRLILSSRNGIAIASHSVVVKTRSDVMFLNNSLLKRLDYIKPLKGRYAIFRNSVLSTNYYVRNPVRMNLLYHASDILLVGKKVDMELFFSAPLVSSESMITDKNDIKMVAEQHLTTSAIAFIEKRKNDFVSINSTFIGHFLKSEQYLFNNFEFFSISDLGVAFPKKLRYALAPEGNYSMREATRLSRGYRSKKGSQMFSLLRGMEYFISRLRLYINAKIQIFTKMFFKD
ncbi:MAG: WavE lipopolysaccharide synthesis family protein [Pedobacter sp.]